MKYFIYFLFVFLPLSANAYTFDDFIDYGSFQYVGKKAIYSYGMDEMRFESIDEACKHDWDFSEYPYQGYTDRGENTWWCKATIRYRTITADVHPYWAPMPYSKNPNSYPYSEVCYEGWVYRVDSSSAMMTETGDLGTLTMYTLNTYPINKYCKLTGKTVADTTSPPPDEVDPDTGSGGVCFDDNWDEIPCSDDPNHPDYDGGGGDFGGGGAGQCFDEDWKEISCDKEDDDKDPDTGSGDGGGNGGIDVGVPAPDGIASESTLSKIFGFFSDLFKKLDPTQYFPDDDSDQVIDDAKMSETELSREVLGTSSYSEYIQSSSTKHKFNTAASCPQDLTLLSGDGGFVDKDITYSYQSLCDVAIKVNPILVAFGYLLSIFMIVRV